LILLQDNFNYKRIPPNCNCLFIFIYSSVARCWDFAMRTQQV